MKSSKVFSRKFEMSSSFIYIKGEGMPVEAVEWYHKVGFPSWQGLVIHDGQILVGLQLLRKGDNPTHCPTQSPICSVRFGSGSGYILGTRPDPD